MAANWSIFVKITLALQDSLKKNMHFQKKKKIYLVKNEYLCDHKYNRKNIAGKM